MKCPGLGRVVHVLAGRRKSAVSFLAGVVTCKFQLLDNHIVPNWILQWACNDDYGESRGFGHSR